MSLGPIIGRDDLEAFRDAPRDLSEGFGAEASGEDIPRRTIKGANDGMHNKNTAEVLYRNPAPVIFGGQ